MKPTTAPPTVNRAEQWARLRTAVLSDAAKHSAAAKNRTLRKHGKTIPAMVDEMDRLYEKLASAAATEAPVPRRGITQKQLEAFMADGMPGVWRIVIDTGAEANVVPENAPLADLQVANALITGASSAVPVVSKTTGNATVVAGTAEQPVHIPVVGAYVVKSLPDQVILLSYAQLRKVGFRLIDKPGDEDNIFLMSPTHPTDGKKYRIKLELERHGILTVQNVVSVEAGLRKSPSWLQNTSVYTLVTAGSGAPVKEATENLRPADQPSTFVRAFMVTHDALVDGLPDEEPEPKKEWARQPKVKPVWRNDRSAAVHQPAKSPSQAKRAAKKAKLAAHKLAATDSAVEFPVPDLGQSAAAPAAAIPAAPERFVLAPPLPEVAAAVPPAGDVFVLLAGCDIAPPIVVDSGAHSCDMLVDRDVSPPWPRRRIHEEHWVQSSTSAQCMTTPVVSFFDSTCTAAAEALKQVAAPMVGFVDFVDFTCTSAVEQLRQSLVLRGPGRSEGWQRFRAALNRSKAPVPTASSVSEPSGRPTPVALAVTEAVSEEVLTVVLKCESLQLPVAALACLAGTSRLFRKALYDDGAIGNHVTSNPWCRAPEYVAAAACVPCLHHGCHCRLRYQQLTLDTRQLYFEMFPPVHVIAQHLYDRRYGDHNGQRFDSPGDRASVVRALKASFPDVVAVHDGSGRLSLEWGAHRKIMNVTSELKSALAAASHQSAWARLDIGADARQLPVTAACYRCHRTSSNDLIKCCTVGCPSWVHASCAVPQCPHYLTATDCGTSLYRPTRWQCKECAGASESEPDEDPVPGLVSTSEEESDDSDDEPYAGSENLPSVHLAPRHHRSIPDARCPEDDTNPFYRSSYHRRNPCLGAACATSVTFFGSHLQPPRSTSRQRPAVPAPVPEPDFLAAAYEWRDSTVWYSNGEDPSSTCAFLKRHAAGRLELAAWAAADAAPPLTPHDGPVLLSCNMAVVPEQPAAAPRNRHNGRSRRRRERSPTEPTDRRSSSRSPGPQRFQRPAPAAPRRRNGRPIVTLTYPDGVFDIRLRDHTLTVAHQVNTANVNPGGLAAAIADFAPYGDVFRGRQPGRVCLVPPEDRATPGSVRVDRPYGNGLTSEQLTFVAMYAQIHGGGPGRGADDAAHREHYFAHCLDAIVPALPRIDSIAFPKYIGCEIAGGNWDNYSRMIRQFAGLHPHLQVYIVERGPVARMNGQPISPAQRHRVPGSQSSRSVPTSSASHRRSDANASAPHRQHTRPGTAPNRTVSFNGVEALDVIASQRAADDPAALAAAAARAAPGPAPAPALPSVTQMDQLPGVLGVHVADPTTAGVTYLRRYRSAVPKVTMDWGCGSGSSIEAALEVPDMFAVGFDIFDPKSERVLEMLARWNPRGRPRRAVYVQCLYNRAPTVREIRSIFPSLRCVSCRVLRTAQLCHLLRLATNSSHAAVRRISSQSRYELARTMRHALSSWTCSRSWPILSAEKTPWRSLQVWRRTRCSDTSGKSWMYADDSNSLSTGTGRRAAPTTALLLQSPGR